MYHKVILTPTGLCQSSTPIYTDDIWRWLEDNIPIDFTLKLKVAVIYDNQELPQLRLYESNSFLVLISSRPAVPNRQYTLKRPTINKPRITKEAELL